MIAWTYLLHAFYGRKGVDYRFTKNVNGKREVVRTPSGAEKFWELGYCLRHAECPLPKGAITNLDFLLDIRHEIEHRSTSRIDDALSAALQACCINFNEAIKELFGKQFGLERRLPIALQFVTFDPDQRAALKRAASLPPGIATTMEAFLDRLTDEELADPRFTYRLLYVPRSANRASAADMALEFVHPGSEEAEEISRILLKDVEEPKYRPKQIVDAMRKDGFRNFNLHHHTLLWRAHDAKNPAKGYGVQLLDGNWYWYQNWVDRVRAHCEEKPERYR